LRVERRKLHVLLMILGTVVSAGEHHDHWVVPLQLAEPAPCRSVIDQLEIGEDPPRCDVSTHRSPPLRFRLRIAPGKSLVSTPCFGVAEPRPLRATPARNAAATSDRLTDERVAGPRRPNEIARDPRTGDRRLHATATGHCDQAVPGCDEARGGAH